MFTQGSSHPSNPGLRDAIPLGLINLEAYALCFGRLRIEETDIGQNVDHPNLCGLCVEAVLQFKA